ncbi:response regulator transcription factor [Pseudomonas typographi]|uniref:Response regulator transcription factor n=1 Tax=Pseudomonas typographi TaxID=2715964 RepID=A0ABR7Z2M5_9PSED|nr:response regulator transcription factor [Pseudomonas typographi]MBD1587287.1 response regulator transcription factor [Pseudomonas typographi]MBD1599604.1 response regulator transcription factor [Pseudomonas typographi]
MNVLYLAQAVDPALAQALEHYGMALHAAPPDPRAPLLGGQYDFILLDLAAPAPRLLRQCVRQRGQAAVLVLLSEGDHAARIQALKQGADVCLSRPFSHEELHARMQALLRHFPAPPAAEPGNGLWLSNNRLLLGRGPRQQSVTVTEQRLLALLAVQPGAISRQAIEKHLWGDGGAHRGPLIERHICNLRRKLSDLGAPFALQTLRGYGYCLSEGLRVRTD